MATDPNGVVPTPEPDAPTPQDAPAPQGTPAPPNTSTPQGTPTPPNTSTPPGASAPSTKSTTTTTTTTATASTHDHTRPHGKRKRKRRLTYRVYKRRRRIVWGLIIAAAFVVLAAAWVGFRLWQAYGHLQNTASLVQTLEQNLKDGDSPAAHDTLAKLQTEAGAAHSEAHDFLWTTAEYIPAIGANLQAVRVIADSIDTLSWQTLPPLVQVASSLDPAQIAPKNGAINVSALKAAAPEVVSATQAIHNLQATVAGIDRGPLLNPVADAVNELDGKLTKVSALADTASKAAQLLPPMLGADGKRTYLVVFQNLAELRSTGGIFGAYAVITADHGTITLVKQGATSSDMPQFSPPVAQLSDEAQQLYTERPAIFPMDVNLSPDFPTAATLIREMYQQKFGTTVDGVIATDPVALADVLTGTGPVKLDNGVSLDASNAVSYLLAQAYQGTTPAQSDALFKQAAKSVFTALVSGQGSAKTALAGLEKAAGDRRLLIWSANPDEEKLLAGTVLEGALPAADGSTPTVGVYLNDGTGGKMDYYLREKLSLASTACRSDGRAVMHVTVTLTSTAPSSGLPDYVTGLAMGGPYVTRTNVMLFSPTGGSVQDVTVDGKAAGVGSGTEGDRMVGILTVDLKPGETKTVTATVLSGALPTSGMTGLQLRTTPLSTPGTIDVGPPSACAAAVKTGSA